jgi:hypothetical protein
MLSKAPIPFIFLSPVNLGDWYQVFRKFGQEDENLQYNLLFMCKFICIHFYVFTNVLSASGTTYIDTVQSLEGVRKTTPVNDYSLRVSIEELRKLQPDM